MTQFRFSVLCFIALLLPLLAGCPKKGPKPRDYGKPTWLEIEPSQLAEMTEYDTSLEKGAITVVDPKGWELRTRGAVSPPEEFKTVIVFQSKQGTLTMNKSKSSKGFGNLDEENVEEFADLSQQLFKSPVRMLKLGEIVGVTLSKRIKVKETILERRIIATSIDGQIYTFELLADPTKVNAELLGALYGLVAHTKIHRTGAPADENEGDFSLALDKPKPASKSEPEDNEPLPDFKIIEDKNDAPKVAEIPIPDDEPVIAKPAAKPEIAVQAKPAPKPAAKPGAGSTGKKGGSTRDMLNELEALLK